MTQRAVYVAPISQIGGFSMVGFRSIVPGLAMCPPFSRAYVPQDIQPPVDIPATPPIIPIPIQTYMVPRYTPLPPVPRCTLPPSNSVLMQLQREWYESRIQVLNEYRESLHPVLPSAPPPELIPHHQLSQVHQQQLEFMHKRYSELEAQLIQIVSEADIEARRSRYYFHLSRLMRLGLLFRKMEQHEIEYKCGALQEYHYREWLPIAIAVECEIAGDKTLLMQTKKPPRPEDVREQERTLDFLENWPPLSAYRGFFRLSLRGYLSKRNVIRDGIWQVPAPAVSEPALYQRTHTRKNGDRL
jgi:hypothetical protein